MRASLRRIYERHRDWPPLTGLRFLLNKAHAMSDRERASEIRQEKRFLRWCCDPVFRMAPVSSDPAAAVEMHTLVCGRHVSMYLTAVKSLLRFNVRVAVVAHDDGSLTRGDRSRLKTHVKGIRIIRKAAADGAMAVLLKNHPRARAFRSENIVAIQLLDFAHLAGANRILAVDSDTLFLKKPHSLIDRAAGPDAAVHLCERDPYQQREFLSSLGCAYPPHFCMGLAAFDRSIVDLDLIEHTLERAGTFDWYLAQNVFPVLIEAKSPGSAGYFLDSHEYQDVNSLQAGAVFRHYWGSCLMEWDQLRRAYVEDTQTFYTATGLTRRKPPVERAPLGGEWGQRSTDG